LSQFFDSPFRHEDLLTKENYSNELEKAELEKISSQNAEISPEVTTDMPEKEIHFCINCGDGFRGVLEFSNHLNKIPQNCKTPRNLNYLAKLCMVKEHIFCNKCGQGFQEVVEFSNHLDKSPQNCKTPRNLDYLSTLCTYCNKKFRSKENVQIHVELVHEKEQPWLIKCTICSESCLDKKVMNDHIVSVHEGKFWHLNQRNYRKSSWCFKCRNCPYESTSKPTMEGHVISEHNEFLVKPNCRLFHSIQIFFLFAEKLVTNYSLLEPKFS
jgi:hypothetical protein